MRVWIVAFGKLKAPGLREAFDSYTKRLEPWVEFRELELKPIAVPDKSTATRAAIQRREGELLLETLESRISPRGVFYLLDETGKALPTSAWANLVSSWEASSTPDIALCIGSSLGFGDEVRRRAKGQLSLGPQTLPHELARLVLAEQIYRAWSVTRGHPYHNEG